MRKRGFTLVEILAAVAILAVLAIIAIPAFAKAKDKAEKNQAITYLRTIRTSEKMYYGSWKTYLPLADKSQVNSALGAELQAANYSFAVTTPTSSTFEATATRSSDSKTVILNQDGTWSGTNTPLPPS